MLNQNPVIDAAMRAASAAVTKTAASSHNDMSSAAVKDAKPELQANISAAIAADPVVQHATNTETFWWQQRSKWSMIVSFVLIFAGPALQHLGLGNIDPATKIWIVDALTTCGNLAAGFLALRAGQALTPLFTPKNPVAYRG